MKFMIELTGTGYTIPTDDPGTVAVGFVVICYVESDHEDQACEAAIQMLLQSEAYTSAVAPHADPECAEIASTYWAEVDSFDGCPVPISPFVLFGPDESQAPVSACH